MCLLLVVVTASQTAPASGATRPPPAACVASVTKGPPPVVRADAVLLCAQPIAATATVTGRWSTCATSPPGPDEDCETGSWTARFRTRGALGVNGLSSGTMSWSGRATGTLTCRRDRANVGPDIPGTPPAERFHRAGSFPIGQVTVAAAAAAAGRGARVIVTVDGVLAATASNRAVETCGPILLGSSDPTTFGKPVDPGVLLHSGTVRATLRQSGAFGMVAALVGGPLRGSGTMTFSIRFRG